MIYEPEPDKLKAAEIRLVAAIMNRDSPAVLQRMLDVVKELREGGEVIPPTTDE